MFEFTGRVVGMSINVETNKANVTLEINEKSDILKFFDEIKAFGKLVIRLAKHRKKRSLNANAYAWHLMGEIAESQGITSEEVYRHQIREVGIFRVVEINEAAADTLSHSWGLHGLGWFAERLDYGKTEGFVLMRLYYGSSSYDSKQMSRLLENIIQDCEALGIQTKTPDEIANLVSLWETERTRYAA